MKDIDKKMNALLRRYKREGKSDQWLKSWKRGWYMVGRG